MFFRQLFDNETSTYTYILADTESKEAVIIDPVRDQVERDAGLIEELGFKLLYSLDTHVHADHVTGAGVLRTRLGCKTVLSKDGGAACADVLAGDGDTIRFGKYALEVRSTPGHTNGCVTYVTNDQKMVFTGDALLIRGTGRTDFQQGDSRKLYNSIKDKIFTLPDDTVIYPGHDYKGRMSSTVWEEKSFNPRVGGEKTEDDFVKIMNELKLAYPKKIDEALPANLKCGVAETVTGEPKPEKAWAPIARTATGIPEVMPEFVASHPGEFRMIDVREPHEYVSELGHVEGAELVPLDTLQHAAHGWDRHEPLVVICRSGGRSGKAAQLLEHMGFQRIASMAGGMLLWNQESRPVARTAA